VVEVAANTEEVVSTINLIAEIYVVDFIDVALVHVTAEDGLSDLVGCCDLQTIHDTEELHLSHVAVLGDIEILKYWLQVDASRGYSLTVLLKDTFDIELRPVL